MFTYFVGIMNNRHKKIIVHCASPKNMKDSFSKKGFHERTIFFGKKIYGQVVLSRKTNDQIMLRFGRTFINDKYIFQ